jgi:hypothetical protein
MTRSTGPRQISDAALEKLKACNPCNELAEKWGTRAGASRRHFLIDLIVAGVLMSRLLLTDEPPTPYCPHCGQPMKLVGISRLLGRSCPTLLELYCAFCDHEEIKEDRVRMR